MGSVRGALCTAHVESIAIRRWMNVLIDLQGLLMRMLDSLYPDLAATLQATEIDIPDMSKLLRRLTQPSSTLHAPAESRREPTKKALIIGINYVAHEKKEMKLRGAHDDARGWMKLCIGVCSRTSVSLCILKARYLQRHMASQSQILLSCWTTIA